MEASSFIYLRQSLIVIADSKSTKCLFFRQNKIQESPFFLLKHHQYTGAQSNSRICSSPTQTPMQKEPLPLQYPFSLHLRIMLPFLCHLWPGVRHCSLGHTAQKSLSALTLINHDKARQTPGTGSLAHGWGIQHPHHPLSPTSLGPSSAACANSPSKISVAFSYQLPEGVRCCREQSTFPSLIVPEWPE